MSNRETLIHAAEILEREALIISDDHMLPSGRWDDYGPWIDYYDLLATARALREMAGEERP